MNEFAFISFASDTDPSSAATPKFLGLYECNGTFAARDKLRSIVSERLILFHGDKFKGLISRDQINTAPQDSFMIVESLDSTDLELWYMRSVSGWWSRTAESLGKYSVMPAVNVLTDLKICNTEQAEYIDSLEKLEIGFAEERACMEHKLNAAYQHILDNERICDLYRMELRNVEKSLAETKQTLTIRTMECKLAAAAPTVFISKPTWSPTRTIIDELGEFNISTLKPIGGRFKSEPMPIVPNMVDEIKTFDRTKLRTSKSSPLLICI